MEERLAYSGRVMELQPFSVNDGEGIRTNIFLAGCPLRCRWCCNPEGQTLDNPLTRDALAKDVVEEAMRQAAFYRYSGGGVTFSGGEATAQPGFLRMLARSLYERGVGLALESCGWFEFDEIRDILELMDLIFMDIKHMDPAAHIRLTGRENGKILGNIRRVHEEIQAKLVIRVPVVEGANGRDADILAICGFISRETPKASLELLPYHRFGEKKYEALGLAPPGPGFSTPSPARMAELEGLAREAGIRTVSYK